MPTPAAPTPVPRPSIWLWIGVCVLMLGIGIGIGMFLEGYRRPTAYVTASPAPSPTADPTANWKTYTNSQRKYVLRYPNDWRLQENAHLDLPYLVHSLDLKDKLGSIQLTVDIYTEMLIKSVPEDKVIKSEKTIVDGKTATKNRHNSFGPSLEVIISLDDQIYRITKGLASEVTFDQILSTFRFIEQKLPKCLPVTQPCNPLSCDYDPAKCN